MPERTERKNTISWGEQRSRKQELAVWGSPSATHASKQTVSPRRKQKQRYNKACQGKGRRFSRREKPTNTENTVPLTIRGYSVIMRNARETVHKNFTKTVLTNKVRI